MCTHINNTLYYFCLCSDMHHKKYASGLEARHFGLVIVVNVFTHILLGNESCLIRGCQVNIRAYA